MTDRRLTNVGTKLNTFFLKKMRAKYPIDKNGLISDVKLNDIDLQLSSIETIVGVYIEEN